MSNAKLSLSKMVTFSVVLSLVLAVGALGAPFPEKEAGSNSTLQWRIVGGSDAPPGAFPYQVSLRGPSGTHGCGGSIIGPRIILTAAHCVAGAQPSKITVVVGSNTLDSGGTSYAVSRVRTHILYNSKTSRNDIAILKLAKPIIFSSTVAAIPLESSNVVGNVDAVLSGWGVTSNPGSAPNDLQYAVLKTLSVSNCKRFHSNVANSQICTLTRYGQGACFGDSGGPLVANGRLVGIVSWGRPCAVGYPDVFTRVSSFVTWINKHSY